MSLQSSLFRYALLTFYYISLSLGYAVFSLNHDNQVIECSGKVRIYTLLFLGQNSVQSIFVIVKVIIAFKSVFIGGLFGVQMYIPVFFWMCFASMLMQVLFYMEVNKRSELCSLFQEFQQLYTNVRKLFRLNLFHRKHLFLLLILIADRTYVIVMTTYFDVLDVMDNLSDFNYHIEFIGTMHNSTIRLFEIGHIISAVILNAICESICEILESNTNEWQIRRAPLDLNRYQTILKCRLYLLQVYKVKNKFNKLFSRCIFLYFSLTFLDNLMNFYTQFAKTYTSTSHTSGYVFFVLFLMRLHLFVHTVEMVGKSYRRATDSVFAIASKRRSAMMIDEYLLQLYCKNMDYKDAFGLFKVRRAFTFSMFAATISYIITLVQFKIENNLR